VTAVSAGSAVITYAVRSCLGNASASKTITVNPITVPNAGTITGASSLCKNAIVNYSSNGNAGGTWTSSNTAVATVNATTGQVKALTVGTTNITYTVTPTCGNAVKSIKTLTVNNCNARGVENTNSSGEKGSIPVSQSKTIAPVIAKALQIEAYPNPSSAAFTLLLKGYGSEKGTIVVTNLLGNRVYQFEGSMRQQYVFGENFAPGIYLVQVQQGSSKQSMKLIKE
jgi:hypothetical protein